MLLFLMSVVVAVVIVMDVVVVAAAATKDDCTLSALKFRIFFKNKCKFSIEYCCRSVFHNNLPEGIEANNKTKQSMIFC